MSNMVAALRDALAKLDRNCGWSLTVAGFGRRSLKLKAPLTFRQQSEIKSAMDKLGLEHRRVKCGEGEMMDVWDYQA